MAGALREGRARSTAEVAAVASPSVFARYLSLDPFAPGEPRHSRHGELRRALHQADDDDPRGEELRRVRDSVSESAGKSREKVRSLQEAIQKLDRYRNIVARKRQRSDIAGAADKLGAAPSSGALRIGAQNNSSPAAIIKRVRSSLPDGRLEGRGNVPTRQGALSNSDKVSPLEKEKIGSRTLVAVPGLSEEKSHVLSAGDEGWEQKLKRRRSVGTILKRGNGADRDVKPVAQFKLANEACPQSSDDLGYRHGAIAGSVAGSKMDSSSPQNNLGSRIIPKIDVDYATQPNERRLRHAGLEKDRATIKGNKVHTSEDMQNRSSSPSPKTKACRSPRTSSLVMGLSSTFQRTAGASDECEEMPYTNKVSPLRGMTNRKRSSSTHSNACSPPITWVGQRPQKMPRTRRTNVVSPVSHFDEDLSEKSPLAAARSAPIESCTVVLTKNVTNSSTQTVTKMDNVSSSVGLLDIVKLSATESKVKEKVRSSGEVQNEDAAGLIFPSNKSRMLLKEDLEDGGVPRQGRSGRGIMHVKGCSSISREKMDVAETKKALKCGRPGPEKDESKVGRSVVKKGSDRKASPCQAQAQAQAQALNCEPEDDREELLAAANAARSAIVSAYSGPFWKKMEPMLTFVSSENLTFLKHQINLVEELEMSMSSMPDGEQNAIASTDYIRLQTMEEQSSHVLSPSNSSPLPSEENHITGPQKVEADKWSHEMAPMAHRLLSALIMEDDISDSNGVQSDILLKFSNSHIPCTTDRYLENEVHASAVKSNVGLRVDFTHLNSMSVAHQSLCNGYAASSNFISSNSQNSVHSENMSDGVNIAVYSQNGPLHDLIPQISTQCQNPRNTFPSSPYFFLEHPSSPYEYQYGQMSVSDKILVELQTIGICPETVPELDDKEEENISKMISGLRRRLHDQVKQKKCGLHKLDRAIQDTKNIEERSLEQHALNKLVEQAHRKLQGTRIGSRHKAGVSKSANRASKNLASVSAFARRTLTRCKKFEGTNKSCFSEPSLWSLLSAPLPSSAAKFTQDATRWKRSKERDRNRDASARVSGQKSGLHSSGRGRSGERKNKTTPKQKQAQPSTSGNVLGGAVESSPTPATQEPPKPAGPPGPKITRQPWNAPGNIAQQSTDPALAILPGLDDMFDVPGGLDVQGTDFSSWFPDGLDDSLPQDDDFSGALAVPDDDLTQLGFM